MHELTRLESFCFVPLADGQMELEFVGPISLKELLITYLAGWLELDRAS